MNNVNLEKKEIDIIIGSLELVKKLAEKKTNGLGILQFRDDKVIDVIISKLTGGIK